MKFEIFTYKYSSLIKLKIQITDNSDQKICIKPVKIMSEFMRVMLGRDAAHKHEGTYAFPPIPFEPFPIDSISVV